MFVHIHNWNGLVWMAQIELNVFLFYLWTRRTRVAHECVGVNMSQYLPSNLARAYQCADVSCLNVSSVFHIWRLVAVECVFWVTYTSSRFNSCHSVHSVPTRKSGRNFCVCRGFKFIITNVNFGFFGVWRCRSCHREWVYICLMVWLHK